MDDREFRLSCYFLEDNQKLIAAGKLQRWETVKWAFTVNLALATASISFPQNPAAFTVLSVFVAVVGSAMVFYQDTKITRARKTFDDIFDCLNKAGVDFRRVVDKKMPDRKTPNYDWRELSIYTIVLALSTLPSLAVYLGLASELTKIH